MPIIRESENNTNNEINNKIVLGLKQLNNKQLMIKVIENNFEFFQILINDNTLSNSETIFLLNKINSIYHYTDRESSIKSERTIYIGEKNTYLILNFKNEDELKLFKYLLTFHIKEINEKSLCRKTDNDGFEIIK